MKNQAKEIPIDDLKAALHINFETGEARWKKPRRGIIYTDRQAGSLGKRGYRYITWKWKHYHLSRVIWSIYNDRQPDGVIDHINGNRDDNRITNLRDVPQIINDRNKQKAKGWQFCPNSKLPYRARIDRNGRTIDIGRFATEGEARAAYQNAREIYK